MCLEAGPASLIGWDLVAVVRLIVNNASSKIGHVATALRILLRTFQTREGDEHHKEDKAGDREHQDYLDNGEARFRFDIIFCHIYNPFRKSLFFLIIE